ncbi:hypothetical protein ROHU_008498 [Labeo rohita]|uniref:Uncharacterized protein n=1 Tax=Labeo rohita TaxID=84645 RepID=A0A498M9E6_LABRO|nr:hypothetical protein ROHU_008498 [Labeo rohita]
MSCNRNGPQSTNNTNDMPLAENGTTTEMSCRNEPQSTNTTNKTFRNENDPLLQDDTIEMRRIENDPQPRDTTNETSHNEHRDIPYIDDDDNLFPAPDQTVNEALK